MYNRYKGDKDSLKERMMQFFKGTGLSEVKYSDMANEFSDLSAMVEDYYLNDGIRINIIVLIQYTLK